MIRETSLESPVGRVRIRADGDAIVSIELGWTRDVAAAEDALLRAAREQLAAYFTGERTEFDLPLAPRGTPWQRRVWDGLLAIPYGTTESYAALAARIGAPGSARAVGSANGANPIAIVVPCHRVIGADGALRGYAGGVETKRRLLLLEARSQAREAAASGRVASAATR